MPTSLVCPSCQDSEFVDSDFCPRCGSKTVPQEISTASAVRTLTREVLIKIEAEWNCAAKAWPRIQLSLAAFSLKVNNIIKKQVPIESLSRSTTLQSEIQELLENLKWQDLFLTTACASGDEAAWEIFRTQHQLTIQRTALRALGDTSEAQEIANSLMTDLFLPSQSGTGKGDNKIGQYQGMGSLEGWIKVIIHRLVIDRFRIRQKNVSLEDMEVEPASTDSTGRADHSIEALETQKALEMISASLTAALARLTPQERLALNLYYLQDVNLKEIGKWLNAHESTASRLIERLKTELRKAVNRQLQEQFKIKKAEIPHILQKAQSCVDLDFKKILAN